jgi:ADP-ribosylglycohydrolase
MDRAAACSTLEKEEVSTMSKASVDDRFVGCLLGLAIGYALGMPVEGRSADGIRWRHGVLSDFRPSPARGSCAGQFTDDTQMMLMHAESILATGGIDGDDLARRLIAWLHSGEVRGIGRSTFQAIKRLQRGTHWSESGRTGKFTAENGTAMRIAPIGLIDCQHVGRLKRDVWTEPVP